jgi:hypothetical protein
VLERVGSNTASLELSKWWLLATRNHATRPPTRWPDTDDTDPPSTSQIEKLLAAEALGSPDMADLQARLGFPIRRLEVLGSPTPAFQPPYSSLPLARALPPGAWNELSVMHF